MDKPLLLDQPLIDDFKPITEINPNDHMAAVMTVDEYLECVEAGGFTDSDGWGHPVAKIGSRYFSDEELVVKPSRGRADLPVVATHIDWYNR